MEKYDIEENLEILEFFKSPKREEDAGKKWGERTGGRVFNHLLLEGFIEENEDKKEYYNLSESGKNQLKELKEAYKKENKNNFLNKPLNVVIISVLLTAIIMVPATYIITIKIIDYENILTVSLYGKQQITLRPEQEFSFNGIMIYNPTSNKINLENIYIKGDYNWLKWSNAQKEENKQVEVLFEENESVEYDTPELKKDYKPYMELEAGESSIMKGLFPLTAPIKPGGYKLYFFIKTLDGKQYEINRPLMIEVVEE